MNEKPFDILIPYYRNRSNGESDRAKALFTNFVNGSFSYDEISNHPDWLAYASAETLSIVLPQMIDEMLRRNDTINFLIYQMLAAVDPQPELTGYPLEMKERSAKLITLADSEVINKVCKFLTEMKKEPPIPDDQLERVITFWNTLQAKS